MTQSPAQNLQNTDFSPEDIQLMLDNIDNYTPEEQHELFKIVSELEAQKQAEAAKADLIEFCKLLQPDYKVGKHHRILADLLMEIEQGREYNAEGQPLFGTGKDRICVNMPPRHGKSQLVSIYFPAWFLGRNPDKKVLMVSHTTDLAVDFGRKVRNIIGSETYKQVFPDVELAKDSKSAGRWNTNLGGEYFACGVGSALAGRGAHLLLVDDPHNEQDILNGNLDVFDKAYEWFTYGARTRLMPQGRVAIVQCMAGDTGVLLADGTERRLDSIRPGDVVATYDAGELKHAKVLNWKSNGIDQVFTITTTSHKIIKANERHPFLVEENGVRKWVRLKHLKPGMALVSLKGATGLGGQKQNQANAAPVSQRIAGTRNVPMHPTCLWDTMGNTKVKNVVSRAAKYLLKPRAFVNHTTIKNAGKWGLCGAQPRTTEVPTSNTGMVSRWLSTTKFLLPNKGYVQYATNPPHQTTLVLTGVINSVLTIATARAGLGRFYAMTATLQLGTQKLQKMLGLSRTSSSFTLDPIISIEPTGQEEVFDVQIERTENFIANGVVSHNTRWAMDDLTGRLTRDMTQNHLADQYEVVEFPAILDTEQVDETTGKKTIVEKPLWPEFFDLDALYRTKASMPVFQWNSQYQQRPTAEEGAVIKREWWQPWYPDQPPECEYTIMTLDAAAEATNRADFSAFSVWGVFYYEGGQYAREVEKSGDSRDPGGFTYTKERLGVPDTYNIVLLNAVKRRLEFPELKDLAWEMYNEWEPDAFIVEKKSSGTPLYQELRRTGMLLQEYTPTRGTTNNPNNKMARLNSVADIVRSGLVWAPQTRWAEEMVEEVAGFPAMPHDDLVDTMIMALMRFRQGGFITLPSDEPEEERYFKQRRGGYY